MTVPAIKPMINRAFRVTFLHLAGNVLGEIVTLVPQAKAAFTKTLQCATKLVLPPPPQLQFHHGQQQHQPLPRLMEEGAGEMVGLVKKE